MNRQQQFNNVNVESDTNMNIISDNESKLKQKKVLVTLWSVKTSIGFSEILNWFENTTMSSISAIISISALLNWISPRKYKYIFVYSTISRHRDAKLKTETCLPYVINIVTIDDLWPLLLTWLTSIPAWISNHMLNKVWDEITYPYLNFNGATVEV